MKQPKMIQETLIDDEDLSADIADLVPVSSKITDAAATYIGKVSKKFGDETIAGDKLRILNKTSELAQEVVKPVRRSTGCCATRVRRWPNLWRPKSSSVSLKGWRPDRRSIGVAFHATHVSMGPSAMPDRRLYMPRCRTCGPLGRPTGLDEAVTCCTRHANQYPNHQTAWYPTHAQIIVKGTPNDCE